MKSIVIPAIICSPLMLTGCGAPDNSAMSCFNPDLYQDGNEYLMVEFDDHQPVAYISATLARGDNQPQPTGAEQQRIHFVELGSDIHYSQTLTIDTDNNQFAVQRGEQVFSFGKQQREPNGAPQLIDFNFAQKGESRHSTFSYIKISRFSDVSDKATLNVDQLTTFHGIEQITTPAGAFSTCHMELQTTAQNHGEDGAPFQLNIHTWYAQKLGVPVKMLIENDEPESPSSYQLIQADINGETFTPTPADIETLHLKDILATANTQGQP